MRSAIEQGRYATEIEPYLNAEELAMAACLVSGEGSYRRDLANRFGQFISKLRRWADGGSFIKARSHLQRARMRLLARERLAGRDVEALAEELRLTPRELAVLRLYVLSDRRPRLTEVTEELGISYQAAVDSVWMLATLLGARAPHSSRHRRVPRERRRLLVQFEAMTDEQLVAAIASKGYPTAKRFKYCARKLYRHARDRGLLDRLFPERPGRALVALRAALRELPEAEIERLAEGLDELERDVLRLRGLTDPPATRRWFRARTDGPRCTRLSVVEAELVRRIASSARPKRGRPGPGELQARRPRRVPPRELRVTRRVRLAEAVGRWLAETGCDLDGLARSLRLAPSHRAVLDVYVLATPRPSLREAASRVGLSQPGVIAATTTIEARLLGYYRLEPSLRRYRAMTDDELEAAIRALGAGSWAELEAPAWAELEARSRALAVVARERGLPEPARLAPPQPQLESPRAFVASLDATTLARLRAALGPAGRAVLEHRLLAETPLTPEEAARRAGFPTRVLRDAEHRLTVGSLFRLAWPIGAERSPGQRGSSAASRRGFGAGRP